MNARLALLGVAIIALGAAPVWAAGKKADESWGKPGVSFIDYRGDALECANRSYGADVGLKEETMAGLRAMSGADLQQVIGLSAAETAATLAPDKVLFRSSRYTETHKHAARIDVVDQLQAIVDACLVDKGYHRFRLTDDQMTRLKALERGTPERQRYLYSLGSSPEVLAHQAL